MSRPPKTAIVAFALMAALLGFSWWCSHVISPQDLKNFLAQSGSLAPQGYGTG